MDKNRYTRRDFIKTISLGTTVFCIPRVSFATEAFGMKPFKFVQLCDTQLGMGGYEHDLKAFTQAVAQINKLKPDFVMICGDLVHNRSDKSFADFNQIKAQFNVPCYCVSGNHDVGNDPTPESLAYYREVVGKDYYSFEHKGYMFVIVNTQLWKAPVEGELKKHDVWLEDTLGTAANKNTPVFVVGHYPLFLEEPDEAEKYMNLPVAKRRELCKLFDKQGVVAMLGGHTHRLITNECKGIQLVNAETISKNFDKRPLGFRVWHVANSSPFNHDFVSLEGF